MSKVIRYLLFSVFFIVFAFIILFVVQINPKSNATLIVENKSVYAIVPTPKLDNKRTYIDIENQQYACELHLQESSRNLYSINVYDWQPEEDKQTLKVFIYLNTTNLFNYLITKGA